MIKMNSPGSWWKIGVLLLACGLTACGGGGGGSDTPAPPPAQSLDTTAPTALVSQSLPAQETTVANLCEQVVIVFSEAMDPASITSQTVVIADNVGPFDGDFYPVAGSDFKRFEFYRMEPFVSASEVTVTITPGVTDVAGNKLDQQVSWKFNTPPGPPLFCEVRVR